MADPTAPRAAWLRTGQEGLEAMLEALAGARDSICFEMYIFKQSEIGRVFREALRAAALRGVRVRVLIDAWGSFELPGSYWQPVIDAGGDCRWFNPLELRRMLYRDHRKLLVCDEEIAFIGGFNVAPEYCGDGVLAGWRDLGLQLRGPLVRELVTAFQTLFATANFKHRRLARFRRRLLPQRVSTGDAHLFLLSPGVGKNPARDALQADINQARRIRLTTPYFLPPRGIRRALARAARRGAQVQLILPGKSDVPIARLAAQSLYARLLRAGVEINEYEPAVLHSKCYLLDDVVYTGSANLDLRSLNINYELLVRLEDQRLAAEGQAMFEADLARSRKITLSEWQRRRGWWARLLERLGWFFMVRLDARLALRGVSKLREGAELH